MGTAIMDVASRAMHVILGFILNNHVKSPFQLMICCYDLEPEARDRGERETYRASKIECSQITNAVSKK
jgi:hypothetical protein